MRRRDGLNILMRIGLVDSRGTAGCAHPSRLRLRLLGIVVLVPRFVRSWASIVSGCAVRESV